MTHHGRTRKRIARLLAAASALVLLLAPMRASASTEYHFDPAVYDITATPNGGIALAQNGSVLIARNGEVRHVADVPLEPSNPAVNGLEAIGNRNFLATTAAGDLAIGGKLWHVTPAGARLVADIGAFERANDPDAFSGPQWKDQRCEAVDGFSAGPQTNPYHLTASSASEALVADAAGNTLLSAQMNGRVDWVAIFTPPVVGGSASSDPGDWMVRFHLDDPDETPCYVQPVPTSVAVGPDGATYVGELTGATAAVFDAPGLSRIWRIAPGAHNVVCPSAECEMVLGGLTSVIDIEFGPDGLLYVVEYDEAGWLPALIGFAAGGTVKACDVAAGTCTLVADGLALPSAITFDKAGTLWLLESNIVAPTVRPLSTP